MELLIAETPITVNHQDFPTRGNFFYNEILGVATRGQVNVVKGFFNRGDPDKVAAKVNYLARCDISIPRLTNLIRIIDTSIGRGRFLSRFVDLQALPNRSYALWTHFQGAVAEVLCEADLHNGHPVGVRFISNNELTEAFKKQPTLLPNVTPGNMSADFRIGNISCGFADGYLVRVDHQNREAELLAIYEIKSKETEKLAAQVERDQQLLQLPAYRGILREALGTVTGIHPDRVTIPLPSKIKINAVIAEERIGLSIKGLSYFILSLMARPQDQADSAHSFYPINPRLASIVNVIRQSRILDFYGKRYR